MFGLCAASLVGGVVGVVMRSGLVRWEPRYLPLLSGVATGWVWWRFGGSTNVVPICLLTWWFVALSAVDLRCRRLPNGLTVPGAIAVTAVLVLTDSAQALLGGVVLFAIYLLVHLLEPSAFGAGDVKLAWSVGSVASLGGAEGWVIAALAAPLATAVVGSVAMVLGHRRARIAHGPSMCVATLLAVAGAAA